MASGATPAGVARATPTEIRPSVKPLLKHKCSNNGLGATVEGVNRGVSQQTFLMKRSKDNLRVRLNNSV